MNRTLAFICLAGLLVIAALLLAPPSVFGIPQPAVRPSARVDSSETLSLEARLTHPWVTSGRTEAFVTVEVRGLQDGRAARTPVHLALVIDRSGSMHGPALAHAKSAALRIVERLHPDDHLSVVHYGSDVEVLPSASMNASAVERAQAFIQAIDDDGGTNIGGGLEAAARELSHSPLRARRALLLTDGRPTEGLVEGEALLHLVRGMRAEGISLSAIGLGEDFQEDLLQALADVGGGAYGYLHDARGLTDFFERDLQLATTTVAREVELFLNAGSGVHVDRVLGARGVPDGQGLRIRLPDVAAGQVERVVAAVTLEGTFEMLGSRPPLTAELRWIDARGAQPGRLTAGLDVRRTDDREVAARKRDEVAGALAARALAAEQVHLAAQDLELGDGPAARARIAAGRELLQAGAGGSTGRVAASSEALAELEHQLDRQEALIGSAPAERASAVKQLKRDAQRDLGRVGSTY